jgi:DNA-binding transcriptional MerR regulator
MTSWQIGELAQATGLTVRALHHYDRIGLLTPGSRGPGGHRRYSEADVRRLHQVVALRGFGLGLAEIATVLDDGAELDPRALVRQQLDQVTERLAAANRLRRDLVALLGMLDNAVEPSIDTLIEIIEGMTTMDRPLTQEQFEQLAEKRRKAAERLSPEQLAEMSAERERLMARLSPEELEEMQRHRAAMLPPT